MYDDKQDKDWISLLDELPPQILKSLVILYVEKSHNSEYVIDSFLQCDDVPFSVKNAFISQKLNKLIDDFSYTFTKDESTGDYYNTGEILARQIHTSLVKLCESTFNNSHILFTTVLQIYGDAVALDFEGDAVIIERLQQDWIKLLDKYITFHDIKTLNVLCDFIASPFSHSDIVINHLIKNIFDSDFLHNLIKYPDEDDYPYLGKIKELIDYLLKVQGPWLFDTSTFQSIYDICVLFIEENSHDPEKELFNFCEKWKSYNFIAIKYEYLKLEKAKNSNSETEALKSITHLLALIPDENEKCELYWDVAKILSKRNDTEGTKYALTKYFTYASSIDIKALRIAKYYYSCKDWLQILKNKHVDDWQIEGLAELLNEEDLSEDLFLLCERQLNSSIIKNNSTYLVSKDIDRFIKLLSMMINTNTAKRNQSYKYHNLMVIFSNLLTDGLSVDKLRYIIHSLEEQNKENKVLKSWLKSIVFEI